MTITSVIRQWFQTWLCCSFSLTLDLVRLKVIIELLAAASSPLHTTKIGLLHISTELANVHAEWMRTDYGCSLTTGQMMVQFFGRLNYIRRERITLHTTVMPPAHVLQSKVVKRGVVTFYENRRRGPRRRLTTALQYVLQRWWWGVLGG